MRRAGPESIQPRPFLSLCRLGMTTVSGKGALASGWLSRCGFAKLTGTWFVGLLGLYGIYALITFFRLGLGFPGEDRAIMVLGPSTIALALLVSAATFAASVMRFNLLTTRDSMSRRIYWAQLALFGLAAYSLATLGPPMIRAMLPGASDLPPETFAPSSSVVMGLRILFPVSLALFAVLSGVVGALVGRTTSRSVLTQAGAVPWLACFGLVGAFVVSFLGTSSLIVQHGFPSVWIIVIPVTTPLIVIAVLAWRECSDRQSLLRAGRKRVEPAPMDPDALDEILSKVIKGRREEEGPRAAAASAEDEVMRLARGIRRVAGSRGRMSEAQVSAITAQLVQQGEGRTQRDVHKRTSRHAAVGEFCSACASLAAGCLVIGSMGGLTPSISTAVVAGLIGSAIVFLAFRDRATPTVPEWLGTSRP